MTWVVLGILAAGLGIIGVLRLKETLRESIPDSLYGQFQKKNQDESFPISGHCLQQWKKLGTTIKVGCRLLERTEPHRPALEMRGEFEIGVGRDARNGHLKAQFDGKRLEINLKGRTVEFSTEDKSLATVNLDTGELENQGEIIGEWSLDSHLKGPGNSDYQLVKLREENYYLCSRPGAIDIPGEKVYSPLIVGDMSSLSPADNLLLVGLGALWHGVMTNG